MEGPPTWLYQPVMAGYLALNIWLIGYLLRRTRKSGDGLPLGVAATGAIFALTGIVAHPPVSVAWPAASEAVPRLLGWMAVALWAAVAIAALLLRTEHPSRGSDPVPRSVPAHVPWRS